MNRITEIEIAGKKYPLNFSVAAARKFCEKYGDLDKMVHGITEMPTAEQLSQIVWMLYILMEQGAAYVKVFEGKEIQTFTYDELESIIQFAEATTAFEQIGEAIKLGMSTEVEVETPKNAKATQEA